MTAMTLAMVRISGVVAFAPFLSSTALPARAKIVFTLAVAYLLAPLVASLPGAAVDVFVRRSIDDRWGPGDGLCRVLGRHSVPLNVVAVTIISFSSPANLTFEFR